MTIERSGPEEIEPQYEADYRAELAFNGRLLELARHNGYSTQTFHNGRYLCWPIPEQLREVAGYMVAVLP